MLTKPFFLSAVLLAVVATSALAAPPTKTGEVYRFADFSSAMVLGGVGFPSMHAACQLDFGPDARMCTSKEFWLSPNATESLTRAWLHPRIVGGGNAAFEFGASDLLATCARGWRDSTNNNRGLTVGENGHFFQDFCGTPRPVTCCAPAR